jgi:hypothetical protein
MINVQNPYIGTNVEKLLVWLELNPCRSLGVKKNRDRLVELLAFLNSPYNLKYLLNILKSLEDIFAVLEWKLDMNDLSNLQEDGVDVDDLHQLVKHLVEHEGDLLKLIGSQAFLQEQDYKGMSKHPLTGDLKYHSVYAMSLLSHSSDDRVEQENFSALQGYVILVHAKRALNENRVRSYLTHDPRTNYLGKEQAKGSPALKDLRDFSVRTFSDEEEKTIRNWKSFVSFLGLKSKEQPLRFRKIFGYSAYCLDLVVLGSKNGGGGGGYSKTFHGWSNFCVRFNTGQSHEVLESDDVKLITVSPSNRDSKRIKEIEELDLEPSENQSGNELVLIDTNDVKAGRLTSKSQVRHLIMANQFFPNQWSQATLREISLLMKQCGKEYKSRETTVFRKKIIAMIMIMLWTGSTIDDVKDKFCWINNLGNKDKRNLREKKELLGYRYDNTTNAGEWVLTPHVADVKISGSSEQIAICREKHNHIELPDPFGIGQYITNAFTASELSSRLIFDQNTKTYRKEINEFLSSIMESHRINEHKISRYLFYKITSEGYGDVADAILITGRYHPLGQTLLHYTSPDKSYLRRIYSDAINDVFRKINKESYVGALQTRKDTSKNSIGTVGSHLCPTIYSVQQLVKNTKKKIEKSPDKNSELIIFHNTFTLYTILMIGYSTGYRAVVDPFPEESEIDPASGMAVISDKDGEDYYNSRIVWVPETVQTQIKYYRQHREKILSLIVSRYPEYALGTTNISVPRLFFLNDKFKIESVRPITMSPLLEEDFPLPINVNRRFLRTELRLRGCPSEVVDAFMGHWSRGQEPWGKYSSISMIEIIEVLSKYIIPILEELDLTPIKSAFV